MDFPAKGLELIKLLSKKLYITTLILIILLPPKNKCLPAHYNYLPPGSGPMFQWIQPLWEKMRRFGLEYCDLPTMLENVADLLRLMALNIDGREQGVPIVFSIVLSVAVVAYFYAYVVSMLWFVFWRGTEDKIVKMLIFSLSMSSSIAVVKLFCLHFNNNRVKESLIAYLSCDRRVDRSSRMYRSLSKHMRVVKRRAIAIWLMLCINGLVYITKPLVMPGKHLMEDAQVLYGMDPMFETPNYEISQTLVGVAVVLIVYSSASIGALMIIVAGYIEAQMRALSNEILHLWDDAEALIFEDSNDLQKHIGKKLKNQYIKHKLELIVQAHAANLSLLRLIDSIFSIPIAIEFGLLAMGLIAELLGGLENTYLQIPFTLLQVTMDCFTGQRLMEASLTFRKAVYACKWENFEVSNKKMVLVILQNSNTMVLSAGGFVKLRYTSLMSVFRSIYSAYTALRSTMSQESHN